MVAEEGNGDGAMNPIESRWAARRARKIEEKELLIRRQAALDKVRAKYPARGPLSTFTDWVAVYVAFQSFIFLVAWQAYPEWDDTQIWPTFIRAALVSGPITLGMWGVARAIRAGSAIPKEMSKHIPYGHVDPDGTVGGTTIEDARSGVDQTPFTTTDTAPSGADNEKEQE